MNTLKALIVGAVASLVMFLLIQLSIHSPFMALLAMYAPFNVPPSAAFLINLNLPPQPLALIIHFLYGILGSWILVKIYGNRVNTPKGLGLSVVLWLIMMVVYSPIIGWGVFGLGASAHELPPDAPLHLGPALRYAMTTLIIHLVYGIIVGWTNKRWLHFKRID